MTTKRASPRRVITGTEYVVTDNQGNVPEMSSAERPDAHARGKVFPDLTATRVKNLWGKLTMLMATCTSVASNFVDETYSHVLSVASAAAAFVCFWCTSDSVMVRFDNVDKKLDEMNKKFDKKIDNVDKKIDNVDKKIDETNKKLDEMNKSTNKKLDEMNKKFNKIMEILGPQSQVNT